MDTGNDNQQSADKKKHSFKLGETLEGYYNSTAEKVINVASRAKTGAQNTMDSVTTQLDINGDGQVGIDDIIVIAIKSPGVRIDRAKFLQKEFFKNHPQSVIDKAIRTTPALAGISSKEIDKIANSVINFERTSVSGISTALGLPGGWAMAATIPADIAQYYGYTLRAVQKLLYLYGFPEINTDTDGLTLDSETINAIIVCLGIMNGAAGANNAIKAMAKALSAGVEKQLMKMALTKGAIYPVVKSVMKWFGVNLTKSLFTGSIKKAIPIVGGIVGGSITFATFKPCCYRLKDVLQDTMLSNPNHVSSPEENTLFSDIITGQIIDVDYTDVPADSEDNTTTNL